MKLHTLHMFPNIYKAGAGSAFSNTAIDQAREQNNASLKSDEGSVGLTVTQRPSIYVVCAEPNLRVSSFDR